MLIKIACWLAVLCFWEVILPICLLLNLSLLGMSVDAVALVWLYKCPLGFKPGRHLLPVLTLLCTSLCFLIVIMLAFLCFSVSIWLLVNLILLSLQLVACVLPIPYMLRLNVNVCICLLPILSLRLSHSLCALAVLDHRCLKASADFLPCTSFLTRLKLLRLLHLSLITSGLAVLGQQTQDSFQVGICLLPQLAITAAACAVLCLLCRASIFSLLSLSTLGLRFINIGSCLALCRVLWLR